MRWGETRVYIKPDHPKEGIFALTVSYYDFAILLSRELSEFKEDKSIILLW